VDPAKAAAELQELALTDDRRGALTEKQRPSRRAVGSLAVQASHFFRTAASSTAANSKLNELRATDARERGLACQPCPVRVAPVNRAQHDSIVADKLAQETNEPGRAQRGASSISRTGLTPRMRCWPVNNVARISSVCRISRWRPKVAAARAQWSGSAGKASMMLAHGMARNRLSSLRAQYTNSIGVAGTAAP